MKQISRHQRKIILFFVFCITYWIMKKRSNEKRKINSERHRFIKKLNASAKRNFQRKCIIVRGYDDLLQADRWNVRRTRASTGHYYIPSLMYWINTRGRTAQKQGRDSWRYRWDNLSKWKMSKKFANGYKEGVLQRRCAENLEKIRY